MDKGMILASKHDMECLEKARAVLDDLQDFLEDAQHEIDICKCVGNNPDPVYVSFIKLADALGGGQDGV